MRTALAPNRSNRPPSPPAPEVSLCVVTYRSKHNYYDGREKITEMCIKSLLKGARGREVELIIWDNDSTPEYHEYLKTFKPNALVWSENIGGYNARRAMLGMARGKYACITYDDVLFSKFWLKEHYDLLVTFPGSLITGIPRNYKSDTRPIVDAGINLYECSALPSKWYADLITQGYIHSKAAARYKDYIVEKNGRRGWLVKMDTQIFGRTETLRMVHDHYETLTIANSGGICERMETYQIMEIATLNRTAYHIGNVIDASVEEARLEMLDGRFDPDLSKAIKIHA